MSYDYTLTIKRKNDNKIIGKTFCNEIKNLTSSRFIEKLNGNIYGTAKMSFDINTAYNLLDTIENAIKNEYNRIFEKKLLSATSANVNVKREFEEEIFEVEEYIKELHCMHSSVSRIIGRIQTLCEDIFHFNQEKNDWEYDPENNPVTYDWDITAEIE
jgi:endonuclease III-like uncharacterized protein